MRIVRVHFQYSRKETRVGLTKHQPLHIPWLRLWWNIRDKENIIEKCLIQGRHFSCVNRAYTGLAQLHSGTSAELPSALPDVCRPMGFAHLYSGTSAELPVALPDVCRPMGFAHLHSGTSAELPLLRHENILKIYTNLEEIYKLILQKFCTRLFQKFNMYWYVLKVQVIFGGSIFILR